MLTLLAAAALAAAPVEVSSSESPGSTQDTPWELFTALAGGVQTQGGVGLANGRIGLTRRVNSVVVPELHLLLGYAPNAAQLSTGFRLGARFEVPREGVRPFAYVSFAHAHESGLEHMSHAPVAMLLGLSEDGVGHRTGADGGLGVVYDFPKVRAGSLAGRAGLRAGAVGLLGSGAPFTLEVVGTFGVLF